VTVTHSANASTIVLAVYNLRSSSGPKVFDHE